MTELEGPAPQPSFAHASEAELARILDFYDVRWAYEPNTFPILWNLDGAVIESFSPDFYLPELDLYVELTTLKQSLVRKKNRKLRRLRELYPGIRIKLFYARDFRALMLKFGRMALVDALSGTSGQVVPERLGPAVTSVALSDDVSGDTADDVIVALPDDAIVALPDDASDPPAAIGVGPVVVIDIAPAAGDGAGVSLDAAPAPSGDGLTGGPAASSSATAPRRQPRRRRRRRPVRPADAIVPPR